MGSKRAPASTAYPHRHASASESVAPLVRRQLAAALTIAAIVIAVYMAQEFPRGWLKMAPLSAVTVAALVLLRVAVARTEDPYTIGRLSHWALGVLCAYVFLHTFVAARDGRTASGSSFSSPSRAANVLGVGAEVAWSLAAVGCGIGLYASELVATIPPDGGYPGVVDTALAQVFILAAVAAFAFAVRRIADHSLERAAAGEATIRRQATELDRRVHERTAELQAARRHLSHNAFHDGLTGLPNRWLFLDRLRSATRRIDHDTGIAAIFLLDLDRFKVVNDSFGHTTGDDLLAAVAGRLKAVLRPADTLARLGGDEFCVVVEALDRPQRAAHIATRLEERLAPPFEIPTDADRSDGSQEVFVTASIGGGRADTPARPARGGPPHRYRDFGTGYSSLTYLKRFPVDVLKLDRSFVSGLARRRENIAIVQVTAEGVENVEQRDLLLGLGCHLAQGWLFGRTEPAETFDRLWHVGV